ncbi:hypothetical protein [Umboniibacter marinipuniceus]|uniref:Uncharacterized protein n=1 Tax=Umboniibacter marinipuniceus TaxID=569599 RepID=A0A3M0APT5_9GAMM|nr:hypothetical protein [Umboniibacter marinipuniceus]RMA81032.1 hypothetical protein DFR27_0822 [Umboniibacter marinipuniceus]
MERDWVSRLSCQIGEHQLVVKWHRGLGSMSLSMDGDILSRIRISDIALKPLFHNLEITGHQVAVEIGAVIHAGTLLVRIYVEGEKKIEQSISAQEAYNVRLNNLGELQPYSPSMSETIQYGLIFFITLFISALIMTFFFKLAGMLDFDNPFEPILFASILSLITLVAIPRLPMLRRIYDPNRMARLNQISRLSNRIQSSE